MIVRSTLSEIYVVCDRNRQNRMSFRVILDVVGRAFLVLLPVFLMCAVGVKPLSAQTYQDLFDFTGSPGGCCPSYPSVMAQGRDGSIYGTTSTGGTANKGTVFKITQAGVTTVLYSFDGTHGSTPVGGLVLGTDGNLYGTTENGGANGLGVVFKITPAGVLTDIYDFTGTADGQHPVSVPVTGPFGELYGTSNPGVAYVISPFGELGILGNIPAATYGPLLSIDNSFYGVTEFGGTNSAGTIFQINQKSTVMYNFEGVHGSNPVGGLVQGQDGNLYGTTTAGGTSNAGVIYRITLAGVYSVLYNFDSGAPLNGYQAYAGLIAGADGNLYGTTTLGGTFGHGVIFAITTGGDYSVLYSFNAPRGDEAFATPMQHTNGRIYGTTTKGGAGGKGVIYSFNDGLKPFVRLSGNSGVVSKLVGILGRGFSQASGVEFNGVPASFHVVSNTFMTTTVPSGETGFVTVNLSGGDLTSSTIFRVLPQLIKFTPSNGKVGDVVNLDGIGLIQTESITVGGVRVTAFTVNSDSSVTFNVPTGAKTGAIVLTTLGGKVRADGIFTVEP